MVYAQGVIGSKGKALREELEEAERGVLAMVNQGWQTES